MKSFSTFLSESLLIERAPMKASGAKADYDVNKYLNPEMRKQHTYNTARDTEGIPKGTSVKVKKVVTKDGKYHAHVEHEGKTKVVPVNHLEKPGGYENLKSEDAQIKSLHSQIQAHVKANGGKPIDLHIGGNKYKVAGARKVEGNVKADFVLHDHHDKPVYYGSLKAGAHPSKFSGYGGFSHMKNASVHAASRSLATNIAKKPLEQGEMAFHKFHAGEADHEHVVRQALFGKEVGAKEHGESNINGVHHGNITIGKNSKGHLEMHSDLDFHNTGHDMIKHLEKSHGGHVGIFVRKGEQGRKIPNTNIEGRGGIGMSNMRKDSSKIRPVK
jgi:hypothetical protein